MAMDSTTMTVELPVTVLEKLQATARQQQRSVSEVVHDLILHALPEHSLPELPQDMKDELANFANLSNDVLWLLARSTLTKTQQQELAFLNNEAQQRSLTEEEQARQQVLTDKYDRVLLRRAEAARLLQLRGYDLSNPQVLQSS